MNRTILFQTPFSLVCFGFSAHPRQVEAGTDYNRRYSTDSRISSPLPHTPCSAAAFHSFSAHCRE